MLKGGVLVADGVGVTTTLDVVRVDCVVPCATKAAITARRKTCCRIVRISRNILPYSGYAYPRKAGILCSLNTSEN